MFPEQWNTEERYRRKNQEIWSINKGSDRNQTEIRRPEVTNIYYNTVGTLYYKPNLVLTKLPIIFRLFVRC